MEHVACTALKDHNAGLPLEKAPKYLHLHPRCLSRRGRVQAEKRLHPSSFVFHLPLAARPVDGVSERRVPLLFPIAAYLFISLAVRRWAESERRATLIFTHDTHGGCESKEPFALFFISPFCAQSCLQRHFRCALTERVGLFLIEKS